MSGGERASQPTGAPTRAPLRPLPKSYAIVAVDCAASTIPGEDLSARNVFFGSVLRVAVKLATPGW
jgi:hypothetical protein